MTGGLAVSQPDGGRSAKPHDGELKNESSGPKSGAIKQWGSSPANDPH